MTTKSDINKDQIILHISNKNELMNIYMPYIEDGGIFIETEKEYILGSKITVYLEILEQVFEFIGIVVWISPLNSQIGHKSGVGIQFPENSLTMKKYFEDLFAHSNNNDYITDTI